MKRLGLAASVTGALVSVALLCYVGMRSGSNSAQPVVMILIGIWVLSPFVILWALNAVAPGRVVYMMMIVIALMSVIVYVWAATGPSRPKPAAPFVGLPPFSWILITVSLVVARLGGKRRV